jgi:hypothetical protein
VSKKEDDQTNGEFQSHASPAKCKDIWMPLALTYVAAPTISPHVRKVHVRINLEDNLHRFSTVPAIGIFNALDPAGPTSQLVTAFGAGISLSVFCIIEIGLLIFRDFHVTY